MRRSVEGEVDHEVAATFLQRHPATTFYLDGAAGAYLTRVATPWLLGRSQWTTPLAVQRGHLALPPDPEGDPQAHPARLRRAPALFAGRGARHARRAQRAGLQHPRRQDPGPLEAAPRPADHLLLAPSRRRRDLDGRHSPEAGGERERDHRRLHDQRQHRGLRSRRPPPPRLPRRGWRASRGMARARRDPSWWTGWRSSSRPSARATWTSRRCATSSG